MKKQKLGPNQLKWIETLEKTKRVQTIGHLYDGIGYCCLGVACRTFKLKPKNFAFDGYCQYLPYKLVEKLKMRDNSGSPLDEMNFEALTVLNDSRNYSFKEIAQILREHPEQYFTKPA